MGLSMNLESVRNYCLRTFPHATEGMQWECLLLRVGGKMFALVPFEPDKGVISFKADPERFAELIEIPGVFPAPYLARAKWVALESWDALRDSELKELLTDSYRLVYEKLPKKTRDALEKPGKAKKAKTIAD